MLPGAILTAGPFPAKKAVPLVGANLMVPVPGTVPWFWVLVVKLLKLRPMKFKVLLRTSSVPLFCMVVMSKVTSLPSATDNWSGIRKVPNFHLPDPEIGIAGTESPDLVLESCGHP